MRSIELLYNTESIHERVAQAIGQMWEQNLGVHVTYRGLEKTGFAAERQETHNFDVGARGGMGIMRIRRRGWICCIPVTAIMMGCFPTRNMMG